MSAIKSFLKSWAGHLGGYVVAASTMVSTIDPKLIPPQYSFLTAVAGLVVVAAHNGYSAGTLNGVATAAANAASAALKAAPAAAAVLLACILLPGLSGCSTTQLATAKADATAVATKVNTAITSPQAQPIISAAALVAVGTAEQHGITAAEIVSIGNQALLADQGAGATLAAVGGVVNAQLGKLNLPAADLAAAEIVEASLGAAITAQVGSNATLAQSQAAAADVLRALVTAAGGTPAG